MSDTLCNYDGKRGETIVAYLYGELTGTERTVFTRHLTRCTLCQEEIDALGDLRSGLAAWSPPDTGAVVIRQAAIERLVPARVPAAGPISPGSERATPAAAPRPAWKNIPAWAQFAAAMLFMGMAAGIANLDITYNSDGVSVRTGWSSPMAAQSASGSPTVRVATQSDLATLAEQLRAELQPTVAPAAFAPAPASVSEEEIVRRIRALIRDSEQRQQRELALRVAELAQDAHAQRQADLVRIDRTLGALQSTTGSAVRRQEQLLNNLAVRVSQRQ